MLNACSNPCAGSEQGLNTADQFAVTSFSRPVVTSKTKPRTASLCTRNGLAGLDSGQRLADVLVDVRKRLRGPDWLEPGLVLDRALEVVVLEGEHSAVGVVNEQATTAM